jgi:hypothetical protein
MEKIQALGILAKIENRMLNKVNLGFNPEVLDILDNVEASNEEIERIKMRISNEILIRLFSIANSAYYGSLKKGTIRTFTEVVSRVGMNHTKALIIILSLHIMAQGDKDVEIVFARSFATSVLGKVLAREFSIRDDMAKRVELGGLLLEIGKIMMILYRKFRKPDEDDIDDEFIDTYHAYLGEKTIDRFALPDYLKPMVHSTCLSLDTQVTALKGIVQLAHDTVGASFQKFHNKLVLESPPPGPERDPAGMLGNIIKEQFNAVGLGKYVRVDVVESRRS